MKTNRTVTGEWDGETISRPKTLAERHPHMMTPKHKALEGKKISKEEMNARFRAAQAKRAGGSENAKKQWETTRSKILAHDSKPMNDKDKSDYQRKTGRGYHE